MAPLTSIDTPIVVRLPDLLPGRLTQHEPITVGVPFPGGLVRDARSLSLADEHGHPLPLQAVPTELWPDGSVRWALLDFQAAGAPAIRRDYRLIIGAAPREGLPAPRVTATPGGSHVDVDTGVAQFRLSVGSAALLADASGASLGAARPLGTMSLTDEAGVVWPLRVIDIAVEPAGDLRCSVRLTGEAGPRGDPIVAILARLQFFAGSAATKVAVTLRNPRRAQHAGGFWELGDPGSVFLRDVSVAVSADVAASRIELAAELSEAVAAVAGPIVLYQDSSGGEHWTSPAHINRHGEVPLAFRGYEVSGGTARRGLRSTPALVVSRPGARIGLAVEQFWQNFPKALEASGEALTLRLWPGQFGDLHELQGGEQKTHHFVMVAGTDPLALDAVFWGRSPSHASATPEWYATAGAIPHLSPAASDRDDRYARLVGAAIEGETSFIAKREPVDEYGWRHFGDLYADHETVFSGEAGPIVSHYNNQYDGVGGCAAQWMRTADPRWWTLMRDLAVHVADIDIYHTDRDKAGYNHGLFWHTFHYVPAGRSSHRSYPRHPKVWGGGPANEHNYTAGLRLHWLLTGDPLSREAGVGLAQWVIDMDDGARTVLRWLSAAPTGLASATQSPDYHGPGRGAGHSILALLDGHRLTAAPRFLVKAEALIRRCVHPHDDIDAHDLLDAERRWSYVVFLQALGRYLDYKEELGEADAAAEYARASLLHYARWMKGHEYPYLDKPEILEYPTETWAAQDMRKCEVFLFAARHAPEGEAPGLLERADFFYDASVSTLSGLETRTCTRPVVLLLSNGFMYHGFDRRASKPREAGTVAFPPRVPFTAQKAAAKKRLLVAAVVFAAVVLASAIAAVL